MKKSDELAAVMRRIVKAYEERDLEAVRGLISRSDETLVVGSAPNEWLYGVEAREVTAAQVDEMAGSFRWVVHRLDAHEEGKIGWAAADTTVIWDDGRETPLRLTSVFRLEDGAWRTVQWHVSAPVAEEATSGEQLTTSLSQLLDAVDHDMEALLGARFQTTTVTLVFSDIEDSTRRTEELGDVIWGDTVERHFAELQRIAAACGGAVIKTMGDGAMLAFSSARDGVNAAKAIQRSVAGQDAPVPFRVRIGVHSGEAMHADGDYMGQTVNKAARIAATADAGQILVSDVVRGLVEGATDAHFGPEQSVSLKGLPGLHDVYEILREGPG